jgi:predicted RNA-binding protein YlqC (UPF0109 family)
MVAGTSGVNGAADLSVTLPLAVQVAPAVGRLFGRDGRDARAPLRESSGARAMQ